MSRIVEVDLDWNGAVRHVGSMRIGPSGRGGEVVSFQYSNAWLSSPEYFPLQTSLDGPGEFYPEKGQGMFGCFGDSAPDRWGRTLIRLAAKKGAAAPAPRLNESDFLLAVGDFLRQGALRFRDPESDAYLAPADEGVPKLVHLGGLFESVRRIADGGDLEEDIRRLLVPGSSLGGARPKSCVVDGKGDLFIAKFPKPDDEWSVTAWEYINLKLAEDAGLNVPECSLHPVATGSRNDRVLVVRRFDRWKGQRIPFVSAMSMLNVQERERRSYVDIAEIPVESGERTKTDLQELWQRMVFNILVSNVDDHLRNHGFLRGTRGWRLSPLYDVESTPTERHSGMWCTSVGDEDYHSTIEKTVDVAGLFRLSPEEARERLGRTVASVRKFRLLAKSLELPGEDIRLMASAYEHEESEWAIRFCGL